ncbi:two-component sensor histidine kinase [Pseudoclavibacter endophyticus]|nr:two-component sensor histidine kinase [Pseudoclavibacter endophyticus]
MRGPGGDGRRAGYAAPWVIDALLGTAVALALALLVATGSGGAKPPDVIAYLFAAGFGALMLLRRRTPRTVLVLSVLGMFAYYTLDYPPIGVAVPVLPALFSAAEAGLMLWSTGAAFVVFGVSLFFRVYDGGEAIGFLLGYESVSNTALFAAAIALGYSVRSRRLRAAQQAEIARLTEAQLEREAELRMQSERERISRELHDTIGHTMSVISLQAGVGAEAVGQDDRAVSDALGRIRSASTRSLRELRSMVRILRSTSDRDETRSIQSLSAVQELVDAARAAGVEVTTDITAIPLDLSAPVDAAAYRVVQESITNVIRHAGATHAQVKVGIHDGRVHISVIDNGRGTASDDGATGGYGMAGMSERVRLLGGTLTTRSFPGAGFAVEATIPASLP